MNLRHQLPSSYSGPSRRSLPLVSAFIGMLCARELQRRTHAKEFGPSPDPEEGAGRFRARNPALIL